MKWLRRLFVRPVATPVLVESADGTYKLSTASTIYCEPSLPSWWQVHGGGL